MDDQPHHGRVAVITGGAGKIGGAVADELAKRGAQVALVDSNPDVEALAKRVSGGLAASGHPADVTEAESVSRAIRDIELLYGGPHILVNCAGIVIRRGGRKVSAVDMTLTEWRRSIDINLTGVFLCARSVLPAMIAGGWGRIISLSSQGGRTGGIFSTVDYGAAKAGIIGFSRTLAVEVGRHGITVNCLAPGRVVSTMTGNPLEADQNSDFISRLPIPRLGTSTEVAATVSFLSTDQAGYITGTTLDINGGGFMA